MNRLKPSAIRQILRATHAPGMISFAGGLPAPELFPAREIAEAAGLILESGAQDALQYSVTDGHPGLRQWVCTHLEGLGGPRATPERVVITQGAQQGIDLVCRVLLDPGDLVFAENPTYLGALQAFAAHEARVVGVEADGEGIRVDALRSRLERAHPLPKLLYLTANFHNPTGTSLSAGRRAAVAALAAEFGVPLLEDDPYGCLRYEGTALAPLCAQPGVGDWIYLGTASKMLAPGLRVGWLVASGTQFRDRIVSAKQAADLHTCELAQQLVHAVLSKPGWLASHLARLCSCYGRRRMLLGESLERRLPQFSWTRPEGGLFLWGRGPEGLDTTELLGRALAEGVAFVPGDPFWVGPAPSGTLRINFSNTPEEAIDEGVSRLERALHRT